ncbi:Uncharacterized protein HZ326_24012 [Fusarium oxysporum f. sp. albedinis]|nr:Uncharacterized protein HZ326_24012 [Fusarium oxysporum f. sp. albedinis]
MKLHTFYPCTLVGIRTPHRLCPCQRLNGNKPLSRQTLLLSFVTLNLHVHFESVKFTSLLACFIVLKAWLWNY